MFGVASYAVAALVYGAITTILLVSHPGGRRATWLTSATAATTLWAGALAVLLALLGWQRLPEGLAVCLDALHGFVWTACALAWLAAPRTGSGASAATAGRWLLLASAVFALSTSIVGAVFGRDAVLGGTIYADMLCLTLIGFLAVEQVFRNASAGRRSSLLWLCLAIGGVFVIDLFTYSNATLFRGLTPWIWQSRGLANAALVPLLVLATHREPDWGRELFVSRQIAFYAASVIGVGCYLLGMGAVVYVIRGLGGQWGPWLQGFFLLAALALLLIVLLSSTIQARFKVFLVKHFYRNKYGYREEWLRLTEALGGTSETDLLVERALKGIARIIGSQRGDLWMARDERGSYEWTASIGADPERGRKGSYDRSHPLVRFLATRGWVVDSEEYAREPTRYNAAFGVPGDDLLPPRAVIVPLDCQGALLGFVALEGPAELGALNFEDHDILKTAGRQIAVVLAQALAQEQLAATRQFEAMNRLSTFLMHDLKNAIAQQELVVVNAQRFGDRPEFIADAISTVQSSVKRMKRVIQQLQGRSVPEPGLGRAEISKVLGEVELHCAGHEPKPQMQMPLRPLWAEIEPEKLASALTHVVRNAQDATAPDGSVRVSIEAADGRLSISVTDTGCGMSQAFIRERLFRPFDSTKGAKGMGIGAYQARDAVHAAGGDVEVISTPGVGTTFRLRIPLAPHSAEVPRTEQPAA